MLEALSDLGLVALLREGSVWLSVDAAVAATLDKCCTGQQDGGPDTALEVDRTIGSWQDQPCSSHAAETPMHLDVEGSAAATERSGGASAAEPPCTSMSPTVPPRQASSRGVVRRQPPGHRSLVAVRLSLEETFFLRFVLDSLAVLAAREDGSLRELGEQVRGLTAAVQSAALVRESTNQCFANLPPSKELWDACRSIKSNFVTSYAAYHHLKSKVGGGRKRRMTPRPS